MLESNFGCRNSLSWPFRNRALGWFTSKASKSVAKQRWVSLHQSQDQFLATAAAMMKRRGQGRLDNVSEESVPVATSPALSHHGHTQPIDIYIYIDDSQFQ